MRISAVILAAGLSTRMRRFKPLLPLGNGTVLSMAVASIKDAGVGDIVVVTGRNGQQMAGAATELGARAVHNPDFEQGMFTSVRAGVRELPPDADAFFLLPVDIPLVRPRTMALLLEDFAEHRAPVTHPRFMSERGHPPLIRADVAHAILAHDGAGGLRTVLEAQDARARNVDVADAGTCFDLDTPEDYDRACERAARLHIPAPDEVRALWDIADTPANTRAHCQAVALAARAMSEALTRTNKDGTIPDADLAEAAALLHDVAKNSRRHEEQGGLLMHRHGFPALAEAVSSHRDLSLAHNAPFTEREIVFLADKLLSGTQLIPIGERYGEKLRRWSHDPDAMAAITSRRIRAAEVYIQFENICGTDAFHIVRQAFDDRQGAEININDSFPEIQP